MQLNTITLLIVTFIHENIKSEKTMIQQYFFIQTIIWYNLTKHCQPSPKYCICRTNLFASTFLSEALLTSLMQQAS
jgi:hypothetical protein